jgi:hypothetical protein
LADAAKQFLIAMQIHYYAGARQLGSHGLQNSLTADDLKAINQRLESEGKKIEQVDLVDGGTGDRQAVATLKVRLANREQRWVVLPMRREEGLWKVDSVAPLRQL